MKHYKIALPVIRSTTNSYDQQMMIEALVEKQSLGGKITFDTEEEYQQWLTSSR
jgi:hypothetical protein